MPLFAHATPVFESGIPGVGIGGAQGAPVPSSVTQYVSYLYIFVLGMVGIAGFVSLVVWGTVWIASGIVDKKAMALESIKNTFIGIGIALVAYTILWTINPDLTVIKTPSLGDKITTSSSFTLLQQKIGAKIGAACTFIPNECGEFLTCVNNKCVTMDDAFCAAIVKNAPNILGKVSLCTDTKYSCQWCPSPAATCIAKSSTCP